MDHLANKKERAPQPTKAAKAKVQTQSKLPMLKTGEILRSSDWFTAPPTEPELTRVNAGGRFVLAPPDMWPEYAQENSGGFVGKVCRVQYSSAQVRFHDGSVWVTWEQCKGWKPLS